MAVDPHVLPPPRSAPEEAALSALEVAAGPAAPWFGLAAAAFALAAVLRARAAQGQGRAHGRGADEKRPDPGSGQSNREVREVVPRPPS